jgi:hypothetical protein
MSSWHTTQLSHRRSASARPRAIRQRFFAMRGAPKGFSKQTNRIRREIAHSQFGHSLGTGPGIFYARNSGSNKELGTFSTKCISAFSNRVRLEDLIFA